MSTKKVQVIGLKGETGVGISSVKQTTTSTEQGGENIVTITLTDGQTSTVKIQNGKQGEQGPQGVSGVYVGSGEMPEGYNVQIDPSGEPDELVTKEEFDNAFELYITRIASLVGGDA